MDNQEPAKMKTELPLNDRPTGLTLEDYVVFLEQLRRFRRHLTAAPTFNPKTLLEQVQFYDDGTNRRLYLYINGTWRYVALT